MAELLLLGHICTVLSVVVPVAKRLFDMYRERAAQNQENSEMVEAARALQKEVENYEAQVRSWRGRLVDAPLHTLEELRDFVDQAKAELETNATRWERFDLFGAMEVGAEIRAFTAKVAQAWTLKASAILQESVLTVLVHSQGNRRDTRTIIQNQNKAEQQTFEAKRAILYQAEANGLIAVENNALLREIAQKMDFYLDQLQQMALGGRSVTTVSDGNSVSSMTIPSRTVTSEAEGATVPLSLNTTWTVDQEKTAEQVLAQAIALLNEKLFDTAQKAFEACLSGLPRLPRSEAIRRRSLHNLAICFIRQGQYLEALRLLHQELSLLTKAGSPYAAAVLSEPVPHSDVDVYRYIALCHFFLFEWSWAAESLFHVFNHIHVDCDESDAESFETASGTSVPPDSVNNVPLKRPSPLPVLSSRTVCHCCAELDVWLRRCLGGPRRDDDIEERVDASTGLEDIAVLLRAIDSNNRGQLPAAANAAMDAYTIGNDPTCLCFTIWFNARLEDAVETIEVREQRVFPLQLHIESACRHLGNNHLSRFVSAQVLYVNGRSTESARILDQLQSEWIGKPPLEVWEALEHASDRVRGMEAVAQKARTFQAAAPGMTRMQDTWRAYSRSPSRTPPSASYSQHSFGDQAGFLMSPTPSGPRTASPREGWSSRVPMPARGMYPRSEQDYEVSRR